MTIFHETFLKYALFAGIISGALLGYLGVYVILKRIVFVGIALSEIAALGIALGFFLGISPNLVSLILTIAGVILFWAPFYESRITKESLIGFSYAFAAALVVLVVSKSPMIEAQGVDLISGNLLYASKNDLFILSAVSLILIVPHILLSRRLVFVSFDKETAKASGFRAEYYELFIYISVGLAIASCVRVAGVLFVFASLVIPPMIALNAFKKMRHAFLMSVSTTIVCVFSGVLVSYKADLPTSPAIVALYCCLFIAGVIVNYAKKRFPMTRRKRAAPCGPP